MRVKRFSLEGPLARTGRNKPRSSAWLPRTRAQPLNGRNLHLVVVDQGAPHAYDAAAGPFPVAFSSSGITPSRYSKNKVLFTVPCAYRVRRFLRGGASLGLWGGALRSVDAKGGKTAPIDVV